MRVSGARVKPADQVSIGVVIRTRDRPIFVTRALATVQAQTHQNWHIVLVNDGGDLDALSRSIATQRKVLEAVGKLTVLDLSPGVGRSAAFNRGVAALETEFVACLDDDDTWDPDYMAALAAFFLETRETVVDLGGVAAQVTALMEDFFITEKGQDIRVVGEETLPPSFRRGEFFLNPLAYACYRQDIYPVQWVLRRDAVLATGGFPEHFDVMEDRAFMNQFLGRYRLAILDRKLAFHHRRVNRAEDRGRNVLLNTLDNPSFDWRLFSDLARPGFDLGQSADGAAVFRSIAADLLSELNYETSSIWQKVDGEMSALRTRLDRDKTEFQASVSALMTELTSLQAGPARPALPNIPDALRAFDLWTMLPATEHAQHLHPGQRFAGRMELSCHAGHPGILLHSNPQHPRLQVQMPATGDWAAIELSLEGLAAQGTGLRVHLELSSSVGYLFETALVHRKSASERDAEFNLSDFEVHACSSDTGCVIARDISHDWLAKAPSPKISIILPRHAGNFRFICHNLVVERLGAV